MTAAALRATTYPYEPAWNRARGDVGLDSGYLALTQLVSSLTQGIVVRAPCFLAGVRCCG